MVFFEEHYDQIREYAKNLLRAEQCQYLDVDDLVNDAYISCFCNSDIEIMHDIKKLIRSIYFKEKGAFNFLSLGWQYGNFEGEQQCKKCNEVLPLAFFRFHFNQNSCLMLESICRTCEGKRKKEWVSKNVLKVKKYAKNRYNDAKKREIDKKRTLEHQKEARENLTDSYIIHLFQMTKKYTKEFVIAHPQLIEDKRKEIISKRMLLKK